MPMILKLFLYFGSNKGKIINLVYFGYFYRLSQKKVCMLFVQMAIASLKSLRNGKS